jgi:hypothetical protein
MKFSWKILLCTMLIMAAACGASGYFFVNYVFQTSMERETRQALDESSILSFAFETAALNIPSKYDVLPDGTVEQIGVYLENSGQHGNRLLRISDENGKVLYVSEGFTGDTSLWEERGENTRVYTFAKISCCRQIQVDQVTDWLFIIHDQYFYHYVCHPQ